MDHHDRQAIERLFANLASVEQQSGARDSEAERFIGERIASQATAPYFMAQTIVVQEQALEAAQDRIAELEHAMTAQPQPRGGFLASLFGNGKPPQPMAQRSWQRPGAEPQHMPQPEPQQASPWGRSPISRAQSGAGGGFLAGAAQTAMGVAGGVMLGNALGGMFGANEAKAAEPKPEQEPEPADDGGDDDFDF